MKSFRKIFATVVLTLAISVSSFSGESSFPGSIPPPQYLTGETSFPGTKVTVEIVTSEGVPEVVSLDPVTKGILSLFQGLMLIF